MAGPPLAIRTAFLLQQTGRAHARRVQDGLLAVGLRPKQFALLNHVALDEGGSQRELGRRLGLDPSGLVGTLDELERHGLLERRADPADRRRRALHLSAEGRALLTRGRAVAREAAGELFAPLDEAEVAALHDLLAPLAAPDPLGPPVGEPEASTR